MSQERRVHQNSGLVGVKHNIVVRPTSHFLALGEITINVGSNS